jgi:hypothetical protein
MTVGTSPEPSDSTTGSRHNRWRFALLIGTGVTATVLFATISRIADFPILDTLWLASPDQVELLLEDLSTTQRGAYRVMLRIDYLYAGAYTAFLVTAIALSATPRASGTGVPSAATSRLRSRITRVGLTAAILTGTLDVIENSLALALLSGFFRGVVPCRGRSDRSPAPSGSQLPPAREFSSSRCCFAFPTRSEERSALDRCPQPPTMEVDRSGGTS